MCFDKVLMAFGGLTSLKGRHGCWGFRLSDSRFDSAMAFMAVFLYGGSL